MVPQEVFNVSLGAKISAAGRSAPAGKIGPLDVSFSPGRPTQTWAEPAVFCRLTLPPKRSTSCSDRVAEKRVATASTLACARPMRRRAEPSVTMKLGFTPADSWWALLIGYDTVTLTVTGPVTDSTVQYERHGYRQYSTYRRI